MPASSCLARQGWLKNTTARRPVSSLTVSSTTARPFRARRDRADCTDGQHGGLVAHLQPGDVGLAGAVDVAPGVRRHQVEDRLDTELGQAGRLALRHRLEHRHRPQALRSPRVRPLLNPQQVRVEGLAALVHLEGDVGILLGEPLLDPPGVRHPGPLALNERHELVRRRPAAG